MFENENRDLMTLSICEQCNRTLEDDKMALFTRYQVCKDCVKKNHRKATNGR